MRYTMRHAFDTDIDMFWKLCFNADFNHALLQAVGGSVTREVLEERTDENGVRHRRVKYTAKVKMPAIAKPIFGDASVFEYTEIGQYLPEQNKYLVEFVPGIAADKFTVKGEILVEPLGDKQCERIMTLENTVSIFGLGKTIEKLLEKSQRESQEQIVAFTNQYIRDIAP